MQATTSLPRFGLGTFRLTGQPVIDSVTQALELGYRAIDTAQIYGNEADIGAALAANPVPRGELFLTTKIWTENLGGDQLITSLKDSLTKLRTEQVELTLIHWPSPGGAVPLAETLGALLEARRQGLTRQIGVSNFTTALLREAIAHAGAANIATNQVELHPYLQNRAVAALAREHGIATTSYMTLGYGKVLAEPVLQEIAARIGGGITPAQVALAWAMQLGHAVIPSSTKRDNLQANLRAQDLTLSSEAMSRIAALDRGERRVDPAGLAPAWDHP